MLLVPGTTAMFQKAGMLAVDGRCKTLSDTADGYVRSDACGAMLIAAASEVKNLLLEEEGGGGILARIVGTAVNQDGRSSSLTAPNGPAQQEVMRAALRSAQLSSLDVTGLQMHGTGTGLGDPIEIGAAAAALMDGRGSTTSINASSLVLMAAKSWTGHAEAGAGVVGLIHAQASLGQSAALPLLHLGGLNPYVIGAMGSKQNSLWSAPRQRGPIVSGGNGGRGIGAVTGVSAFAFQGTNAHALMQTPSPTTGASIEKTTGLWMHQRLWVAPLPHAGLHLAIVAGGAGAGGGGNRASSVRMQCHLLSDPLAYLYDHQVSDKVLFPGAGFFEMAAAAGRVLLSGSSSSSSTQVAVQGAAIPAPLVLPARDLVDTAGINLEVYVDCATGALNITSGQNSTHLRGNLGAVGAAAAMEAPLDESSSSAAALAKVLLSDSLTSIATIHASSHVGNIISDERLAAKDVFFSPAVFDCCLQLGAVPAALGEHPVLKVPAGVDTVLIPGSMKPNSAIFGSALEYKKSAVGSELNYCMHLPTSGGSACTVAGLRAKPLVLGGGTSAVVTAADASAEVSLEYISTWLTVAPEILEEEREEAAQAQPWAVSLDNSASTSSATTCCTATALLQSIASSRAAISLQANTAAVLEGCLPAPSAVAPGQSVNAALLWGMLRSVPQEVSSITASAKDIDINKQSAVTGIKAVESGESEGSSGDAYGHAIRSKTELRSVLQRRFVQKTKTSFGSDLNTLSIEKGHVVITGGTGSLGSLAASWIAAGSTGNSLTLVGRSGRIADKSTQLESVLDASCEAYVRLSMGDAAVLEDSTSLFSSRSGSLPVTAVLHSGGVLADSTLAKQRPSGILAAFGPKVNATTVARNLLSSQPLTHEVLFSSVASLLGSPGQTNYSAANSLLDSLAGAAQVYGVAATSVQWGAWAGAGMAAHDASTAVRVERLGMGMVQPVSGLQVMQSILTSSSAPSIISAVPFLWGKFIPRIAAGRKEESAVPVMFGAFIEEGKAAAAVPSGIIDTSTTTTSRTVVASKILLQRMAAKAGSKKVGTAPTKAFEDVHKQVLQEVTLVASTILGKEVPVNEPLMAAGLDSLSSVEFRNTLESKLGMQLPSTLVFDYPTIAAISQLVASSQQSSSVEEADSAGAAVEQPSIAELAAKVLPQVAAVAQSILGAPVEASAPLMSAGLDSLSSVEFRNTLESKLGLQLPSTLVFDYPSINAIAQHVGSTLAEEAVAAGGAGGGAADFSQVDELQLMQNEIMDAVKTVLRLSMSPEDHFSTAGVDISTTGARFLRALEARLSVKLPSNLLEICPTPAVLTEYLCSTPVESSAVTSASATAGDYSSRTSTAVIPTRGGLLQDYTSSAATATVSVVGMVSRLPGNALQHGDPTSIDACRSITLDRWDTDNQAWLTGGMAVRFAGLISQVADFDAFSFGVPESEAVLMDPQQRLVLECVSEALAQSPFNKNSSGESTINTASYATSCGVFVGCSSEDYAKLSTSWTGVTAYTGTGTSSSVISGRISYTFGLRGPALTIDTACSSSLAGIHMAFNALLLGQCESATGSGVNLLLHPETLAILQKAGMLTYDGRCKTLSSAADGYVRAETVGTLLLQTGEVKAADCLALVAGSAVNQDGRSSSLTAPNGPAQQEVVRAALRIAQMEPIQLTGLQMHGTGTALGDPIEIGATAAALVDGSRIGVAPLALMASKSWTGHAEPAAGIAGLTHAQLALTLSLQLPILHLIHVNEHVGAVMAKHAAAWSAPRQLGSVATSTAVGTSAFAFQGTNAHVVLQSVGSIVAGAPPVGVPASEILPFAKTRCWLAPAAHSLLHSVRWVPQSRQINFAAHLSAGKAAYLWDHQVSGRPIFPGAGYFEIAISATSTLQTDQSSDNGNCVLGASIPAPLVMPPVVAANSGVLLLVSVGVQQARVEVASAAAGSRPTVHLSAAIGTAVGASMQQTEGNSTAGSKVLRKLISGKSKIESSTSTDGTSWPAASFAAVAAPLHDASANRISPSVLDNCLQLGAAVPRSDGQLFVPAGVGAFIVPQKLTHTLSAAAISRPVPIGSKQGSTITDYGLVQVQGGGCRVDGLEAKALAGATTKRPAATTAFKANEQQGRENLMYNVNWLLHSTESAEWKHEVAFTQQHGGIEIARGAENNTAASIASAVSVAQNAIANRYKGLSLLTSGAALGRNSQILNTSVPTEAVESAGLWGLARTVASEVPSLHTSAVDIASSAPLISSNNVLSMITSAATAENEENEKKKIIDASPYGCRVDQGSITAATLVPSIETPAMPPFRLFPTPRGALQNLIPEVLPSNEPASGRVFVSVKAVGINFRDVLNVLGMYPGDPGPPGGDCAGVVIAVGPNSNGLKPGDAVFGLAGGCLGSHVDASAHTLVPMPATLSFESAATTPTVFITVDAAFRQAAAVQPGERVLVHAAAGGVGLAAIQQAAALGGEVIATGGSTNKRNLVRSLGARAALGSRDTMFVSELAELGGADVVLNSLTSSGMVAGSLSGLRCGGRFVEISKRDIFSPARVAQERPDVLYNLVAVDFLPDRAVNNAMTRLSGHLATGTLQPLPQVIHNLGAARAALRQMSQARHVGKVVTRAKTLQEDHGTSLGTVMVTGGLGMIGSLVSGWLAKQSVQRIVLLGRSGRPGGDSGTATSLALEGAVAMIAMFRCDASNMEEVEYAASENTKKDPLQVREDIK
jgi:acyl transferase domain-containing protein/NADPH:quinone reductase-like Zn-dependent oxidoreductase/acyl carrier protein